MPEISRFYGIVIKMYHADHPPPHLHAEYGEHRVLINLRTLGVFAGSLPPRALALVIEWAAYHQQELLELWEQAAALQSLSRIDPLP